MKETPIGRIASLARYPVKSMAGQMLAHSRIETYGLYGDRSHAFVDPSLTGWERYYTARHYPGLLGYRASMGDSGGGEAFGDLHITAPDGRTLAWDDSLLREIQRTTTRKLALLRHEPVSPELLSVDAGAVLILTDRSLDGLESLLGTSVDPRRFRANLVIALTEDGVPDEREWVGRGIRVGEARLAIDEPCERCMMITLDPDTQERDPKILRTVQEAMELRFGVYASVVERGGVTLGDPVYWE